MKQHRIKTSLPRSSLPLPVANASRSGFTVGSAGKNPENQVAKAKIPICRTFKTLETT